MNKKRFIILIVLMVMSLGGLIWVQLTWIANAVKVKSKYFDYFVETSLAKAAHSMEVSRRMDFLHQQFMNTYPLSFPLQAKPRGNFSSQFSISTESLPAADSIEIVISTNNNPPVTMKVPKQYAFNDSRQNEVNDPEGYDGLSRQAEDNFQSLSNQLISEMYYWERDIKVDKDEVFNILKAELLNSEIETPFELAILRADTIYDGVYSKVRTKEFAESPYKITLFADGLVRKGETISVVFPHKTTYVLGSIGLVLGGYTIFTLIILSTFALSLYFIISQKKISEMKSDFINNMTHEFKTPIATISVAADTISNNRVISDEGKVRHFIGMIKKENARMNRQVETILQIATLDKREMEFDFREIDFHELVNQAIDTIEIQVNERGGAIERHLNAANHFLRGDFEHLRNLVHNLLDNANKYSENKPEITVSTYNLDKGIVLKVEDKGIGMSKAVQSRVFERFYRQTSGNIHNVKGFGLGLNYVKAITDTHGGTVTVESEPGKGSAFTVYLPFKDAKGHE